nr:uncharacterized protein LOC108947471 [Nicotiana tomentosiformis]
MAAAISPQPLAVGEAIQNLNETLPNTNPKQSYATQLHPKHSAAVSSKVELFPVKLVHGESTIVFSMEEFNQLTREEGVNQAVVVKFSYGKPELQEIRKNFPSQFDVQGRGNVGQLEYRHLLVRFDGSCVDLFSRFAA